MNIRTSWNKLERKWMLMIGGQVLSLVQSYYSVSSYLDLHILYCPCVFLCWPYCCWRKLFSSGLIKRNKVLTWFLAYVVVLWILLPSLPIERWAFPFLKQGACECTYLNDDRSLICHLKLERSPQSGLKIRNLNFINGLSVRCQNPTLKNCLYIKCLDDFQLFAFSSWANTILEVNSPYFYTPYSWLSHHHHQVYLWINIIEFNEPTWLRFLTQFNTSHGIWSTTYLKVSYDSCDDFGMDLLQLCNS